MRRLAAILFASLEIAEAHGQPASSTLKGLDECVAQTRTAEAVCDQAGSDAAARLACRLKAHSAEKQCLDNLFAHKEEPRQPGDTSTKPRARIPPGPPAPPAPEPPPVAAQPAGTPPGPPAPPAPEPPPAAAQPAGTPPGPPAPPVPEPPPVAAQPARTPPGPPAPPVPEPPPVAAQPARTPPGPPAPPAPELPPVAAQPNTDDATAALPAGNGWLVSETTSPRDFSPLFVAKLFALPPLAADAPETLVLRCRNQRTEMSLGANGVWRALRGGSVEVVISSDQPAARAMRWRLAVDGRTAIMPDDPVELVRGLGGGRTSISVTDDAGRISSAIFDLAGIDTVRARLGNACRWPNATVESRGR